MSGDQCSIKIVYIIYRYTMWYHLFNVTNWVLTGIMLTEVNNMQKEKNSSLDFVFVFI